MGYTTDFSGRFELNKELSPKMEQYLKLFNETRRMERNTDEVFGVQGEFYVFGGGSFGQDHEDNVVDFNEPPSTQPSLWNQWTPSDDRMGIEWDCGEKFYNYTEWLVYLIHKILAPNGYVLNGVVEYSGEEVGDVGEIVVVDNRVFVREKYQDGDNGESTPQNAQKFGRVNGNYVYIKDFMRTDVVLILDGTDNELPNGVVKLLENN
jgi:hypothetical protein